jgi:UPF0148 protein
MEKSMKAEDEEKIRKIAETLMAGAKMLSIHCATCFSPLFEQDGRIFCPLCGDKQTSNIEKVLKQKLQNLLSQLEKETDHEKVMKLLQEIKAIQELLRK